jgi:hypothetical protein
VLRSTPHNGWAVIERGLDGEQRILGIVLRSQLLVLLRLRRCFQPTSFVSEVGSWRRPRAGGMGGVFGCKCVCCCTTPAHATNLHRHKTR